MRVLFEYDAEKARALVEDYGLPVDAQREKNLNRFIAHIGKSYTLYLTFTEESPDRGHVQRGASTGGIGIMRPCHATFCVESMKYFFEAILLRSFSLPRDEHKLALRGRHLLCEHRVPRSIEHGTIPDAYSLLPSQFRLLSQVFRHPYQQS